MLLRVELGFLRLCGEEGVKTEDSERKHKLFVDIEEMLRDMQEKLLWWVEARNRAKELMLWALRNSPKRFDTTFELLRDAYREMEVSLRYLKKVRDLQLQVWRIEEDLWKSK